MNLMSQRGVPQKSRLGWDPMKGHCLCLSLEVLGDDWESLLMTGASAPC